MTGIRAVFVDLDGVIMDTERDGHRVAFNQTFKEFGFTDVWDVAYYHELLQTGGGKERMKRHWATKGFSKPVPEAEIDDLIAAMHKRKTAIMVDMIEHARLPLRPGIHRFLDEAMERDLSISLCTTSNEATAMAVTSKALADIRFDHVLAGDIVSRKKPDPAVYLLALKKTGLGGNEAFVIEDSRNGVMSARGAGLHVLVTTNGYTESEDLSDGDIIVTCLGDPDGEKGQLRKGDLAFDGVLRVEQAVHYFER
jgi:HAD superfamily hydrolase (TIGR01509 family)